MKVRSHQCQVAPTRVQTSTLTLSYDCCSSPFFFWKIGLSAHTESRCDARRFIDASKAACGVQIYSSCGESRHRHSQECLLQGESPFFFRPTPYGFRQVVQHVSKHVAYEITREAPTASPKSLPISGAENEPSGHMRCCSYTVEVGPFQAARF